MKGEGLSWALGHLLIHWNGTPASAAFIPKTAAAMPLIPHSELAMHCRIAGKRVTAFSLAIKPHPWFEGDTHVHCSWASVLTSLWATTEGLPHELLPVELVNRIEASDPKLADDYWICEPNKFEAGIQSYEDQINLWQERLEAVKGEVVH